MIDAPPLPPPTIVAPAPREVSFGRVSGTVPAGTRRLIVRVRGHVVAEVPLRRRSFSLRVPIDGVVPVSVTAVDGRNRRATRTVDPVHGLPPAAMPRVRAPALDRTLARTVASLAREHGGTTGIYVEDLQTGRGAAWNAKARFPAASTLKLAIAVTVLRNLAGKPDEGSAVARALARMIVFSDNEAANELEVWLAGSTSAGSSRVNETMRSLGLTDSEMYGGYETRRPSAGAPIPIRVESSARLRRRQVHDRCGSRTAGAGGVSRRRRQGAAAPARRQRVRGALPAVAALTGLRPWQARPLHRRGRRSSCTRPAG